MKRTKKILVIEDDLSMEVVLTSLIQGVDPSVEIVWASSAEEAWDLLRDEKFQLVVTDIFLEGKKTGMDFWQELEAANVRTPVIVMSSLSEHQMLNTIDANDPAPVFLPKPLRTAESRAVIREMLMSGRD